MPRDRSVKGTKLMTYNWAQVPRPLLVKAHKKCKAEGRTLKGVLIALLSEWTEQPSRPTLPKSEEF